MADQEVQLDIKATYDGAAVAQAKADLADLSQRAPGSTGKGWDAATAQQYPETVAKIQQLYQKKASYTAKGWDDVAQSTQRDLIDPLENDLNRAWKESIAGGREHLKVVQEGHRELKGQTLEIEKQKAARLDSLGRAGRSGLGAFDSAAGVPGGGVLSALTNPVALGGIAIGAYLGELVSQQVAAAQHKAAMEGEYETGRARRAAIASGAAGDSDTEREAMASGDAASGRRELEERLAKRGNFKDTGNILDIIKGAVGLETTGKRAERENNDEIANLQKANPEKEALAYQEAMKGPAEKRLEYQKAVIEGHMQEARAIEHKLVHEKAYNEAIKEFGRSEAGQKKATEAAGLAEKSEIRKEGLAGEGLVDAHAGAADVARAAALASFQMTGHNDRAVREQTDTMVELHWDAKGDRASHPFLTPNLRGQ